MLVHDFVQDAAGQAVSYSIYGLNENHGYVGIENCFDTPPFAVDTISDWWQCEGYQRYTAARTSSLYVLCFDTICGSGAITPLSP